MRVGRARLGFPTRLHATWNDASGTTTFRGQRPCGRISRKHLFSGQSRCAASCCKVVLDQQFPQYALTRCAYEPKLTASSTVGRPNCCTIARQSPFCRSVSPSSPVTFSITTATSGVVRCKVSRHRISSQNSPDLGSWRPSPLPARECPWHSHPATTRCTLPKAPIRSSDHSRMSWGPHLSACSITCSVICSPCFCIIVVARCFAACLHFLSGSTMIHFRILNPACSAAAMAVPNPANRSSNTIPSGGYCHASRLCMSAHRGPSFCSPNNPRSLRLTLRSTNCTGTSTIRSHRC